MRAAGHQSSLGALQVAILLVSASYGIGFLFGSGELAVRDGMAGSLYALATATGMLALAMIAPRLWRTGKPVWDTIGQTYGHAAGKAVAMLSLIWMAGVVAAQIQGGAAILGHIGCSKATAFVVMVLLVTGASTIRLEAASALFALGLVASNAVLLVALWRFDGIDLYVHAVPLLVAHAARLSPAEVLITVTAVVFLVVTGADYHQFVLAARGRRQAAWGCAIAGLLLLATGFLPAAAVLAAQRSGEMHALADAKQAIPWLLTHATQGFPGSGPALLLVLLSTALGTGGAVVRAMAQAWVASTRAVHVQVPAGNSMDAAHGTVRLTTPSCESVVRAVLRKPPHPAALSLCIAVVSAGIAWKGDAIVATMVALNIVYICGVWIVFLALVAGLPLRPADSRWIMAVGAATAGAVYALALWGSFNGPAGLYALTAGMVTSSSVWIARGRLVRSPPAGPAA